MVDLRRDLSRGRGHPAGLRDHAGDPRPTYLRIVGPHPVQRRRRGRPGTGTSRRPRSPAARCRPWTGWPCRRAAPGVARTTCGSAATSSRRWLPTTELVADIAARAATGATTRRHMDFISADDDVTTAGKTYDFTGVEPRARRHAMDRAPLRRRRRAAGLHRGADGLSSRGARAGGERHRRGPDPLPEGPGPAAVVPRGRRLPLRRPGDRGRGRRRPRLLPRRVRAGRLLRAVRRRRWPSWRASCGIPARVAVGFLEPTSAGHNTWEFSAHDLHAWPELYFPGSGWVRFEPTPGQRAEHVPTYTRGELPAIEEPSVSPGATRSSDALPDRGQSAGADAQAAADDGGPSIPWLPIVLGAPGAGGRRAGRCCCPASCGDSGATRRLAAGRRGGVGWSCATSPWTSATPGPRGRSPRAIGDVAGRAPRRPRRRGRAPGPPAPGPGPGPRGGRRARPAGPGSRRAATRARRAR